MNNQVLRWVLGLIYIVAVAAIWIAASFVVQSVVDEDVSPFLITYICNSLAIIYIPIVEIGRYLEDIYGNIIFRKKKKSSDLHVPGEVEEELLQNDVLINSSDSVRQYEVTHSEGHGEQNISDGNFSEGLDSKGRWTRSRIAMVSLLIFPFWFLAQLTFNYSLKYTSVTSNTILSSSSSLFTFLVSLAFLGEKFTWVKLFSVLLCMSGTIIVSLGDSQAGIHVTASNPLLGDILTLVSAAFYSIYITLIRIKLPDDNDKRSGQASMLQFIGFLGLFNLLIFLPVALVLNFTKLETFSKLTWNQVGLLVGKGLLDNALSNYLCAKAVLLTTTTVVTAGLTIQVPLAAVVDALTGNAPNLWDYIGACVVMLGFAGITIPFNAFSRSKETRSEPVEDSVTSTT